MRLLEALQHGWDGEAFRMGQGHVPASTILQESVGKSLKLWIICHAHVSLHIEEDGVGRFNFQSLAFYATSCEQKQRVRDDLNRRNSQDCV